MLFNFRKLCFLSGEEQGAREMFYFLNLYSYREYSRKKTNGFNSFNFFNSFNSKKLSECETSR